jgi:ring-1,2-phenylacetyl-CoA epoxidase subunit PaaC
MTSPRTPADPSLQSDADRGPRHTRDAGLPGAAENGPSGVRVVPGYLLGLADDAMVYAQRLGEWMTNAPQIEEDMALGNIALDLLGQARALYPYVGSLDGTGRGEDDYAMQRDERDWHNVHLVEQERGDFADEMARLLWFSAYQVELHTALCGSSDDVVAGVAGKALKEVRYHLDHSSLWVVRLGDGTDESHRRMQAALERVVPYVAELFDDDEASVTAARLGFGPRPSSLHGAVVERVGRVVDEATLTLPAAAAWRSRGGRAGIHSRPLGYLLAEMQHIARSHPGATW